MADDRRHFSRELDWEPSYVSPRALFPEEVAGTPWLPQEAWASWEEPFHTTFAEYAQVQADKEQMLAAVRATLGNARALRTLDRGWLSVTKLHGGVFALAEFAAVIGNLRAARFGRNAAWRTAAAFGALDELRHTQVPLVLFGELVKHDAQFDWTHRLYHTNNWVAIAARHLVDEMLLGSSAIEFAVAANFVFETGFTNLQFMGLSALADRVGDQVLRSMLSSIQSDEARHAQIGRPTVERLVAHDRPYAQYLVDKWFWRSWNLFAVVTGIAMDYLTPLDQRGPSFKEFVEEWVIGQFLASLDELGLDRPWYWDVFERSLDHYHHMVYASAYSYRSTVWFDMVVPGPDERRWLASRYPESWSAFDPVWDRISELWSSTDAGVELAVHGTAIPTFCHLCQLVLSHGTPQKNDACEWVRGTTRHVFCSEPCRWIFQREPERYQGSLDLVRRVLAGEAPGNLTEMLTRYADLRYEVWGKDAHAGEYPFIHRGAR